MSLVAIDTFAVAVAIDCSLVAPGFVSIAVVVVPALSASVVVWVGLGNLWLDVLLGVADMASEGNRLHFHVSHLDAKYICHSSAGHTSRLNGSLIVDVVYRVLVG